MIDLATHLRNKHMPASLQKIMCLIAELAKPISREFHSKQHYSGTKNISGDEQMALDKWADQLFIRELKRTELVKTIASEEQDELIEYVKAKGTFGITLDPLDGSSLLGVNLTVGTIVGIYDEGNVMEEGKHMDGAMYLLYGPVTILVYTTCRGVHEFRLDHSGKYVLEMEHLMIPRGKIYAPGGLRNDYGEQHRNVVHHFEEKGYKLRYSGSLVADFHQILHKGGIFMYPALKSAPEGKLRLLFEANPLGLIAEQAGGACSNGKQRIRDIKPRALAQRVPLYIGGRQEVEAAERIMSRK